MTPTKPIPKLPIAILTAAIALAALPACSHPQDSWVMTLPPTVQLHQETPAQVDQSAGLKTVEPPKVEFLFVEDNSDSMAVHIKDVDDNIDQFVNEFSRNNPVDFHFAVVSVYDSKTYQTADFQQKPPNSYYRCGQFHKVKDANDQVIPNKYFISSTDSNWQAELKNTMEIGIQHLAQGGPNYEETFSPVAAVWGGAQDQPLEFTGQAGVQELAQIETNRQGYRFGGDNAYKIVFFITDANDDSTVSSSVLFDELKQSAGGDSSKVWGFAAIVPPKCELASGRLCPRDDAGPPTKIEKFLQLANHLPFDPRTHQRESNIVSLYNMSFGKKFADWGKSIREQTITQKIPLQDVPVISNAPSKTLRVYYGNQEIPWENKPGVVGYTYDPASKSVIIDPKFQLDIVPGAKLHVVYSAIPPEAVLDGRVKDYSAP